MVCVEYEINDDWKIYNIICYGKIDNGYLVISVGGIIGYVIEDDVINGINGYIIFMFGIYFNWQDVEYFVIQLNLFGNVIIGDIEYKLLFSVEYVDYFVLNGCYVDIGLVLVVNCWVFGCGGVSNMFCGLDVSGNVVVGLNIVIDCLVVYEGDFIVDYSYEVSVVLVMDIIQLIEVLMVFVGICIDFYGYSNNMNGCNGEVLYVFDDILVNGYLGVVYEVVDDINFYVLYGIVLNINGGELDVGGNCGYGGVCIDLDGNVVVDFENV